MHSEEEVRTKRARIEARERMRDHAEELFEALVEVEWAGSPPTHSGPCCPSCQGLQYITGHTLTCPVGAALAKTKVEVR